MTVEQRVLFDGRVGEDWSRVWLQPYETGIGLLTHDGGPGVERHFGTDDIETWLVIDGAEIPALAAALRAEQPEADASAVVIDLLAARYGGDSAASSRLRAWLDEHGIAYRFTLV
jgi:hypothetical protein